MQCSLVQKRSGFWFVGLQSIVAMGICYSIGAGQAQEIDWRYHRWTQKPSAGLASKFQHWRLKFEEGKQQSAPEKGMFPTFGPGYSEETARLIGDLTPVPFSKFTAVARRVRYVPKGEDHTDPADRDATSYVVDALRSPAVVKFVEKERINSAHLHVAKHFAVALVQDFDAALRTPNRREHVWSINWRVERQTETSYDGYEAWGLFTSVNGALQPFYLAGRVSDGGRGSYYYVLATGDLNSDGIDELVAQEQGSEMDEADIELWAMERGAPVTIYRMPWR
jgi:hypothetical protein